MTMRNPGMSPNAALQRLESVGLDVCGATVYVVQRHVSPSGLTRWLSLFAISNGDLRDITAPAAALLGEMIHDGRHALKVEGTGMDMHFYTVYRLSSLMFDGQTPNDADPGYALRHRTI